MESFRQPVDRVVLECLNKTQARDRSGRLRNISDVLSRIDCPVRVQLAVRIFDLEPVVVGLRRPKPDLRQLLKLVELRGFQ